jgi:hypothetical protein
VGKCDRRNTSLHIIRRIIVNRSRRTRSSAQLRGERYVAWLLLVGRWCLSIESIAYHRSHQRRPRSRCALFIAAVDWSERTSDIQSCASSTSSSYSSFKHKRTFHHGALHGCFYFILRPLIQQVCYETTGSFAPLPLRFHIGQACVRVAIVDHSTSAGICNALHLPPHHLQVTYRTWTQSFRSLMQATR